MKSHRLPAAFTRIVGCACAALLFLPGGQANAQQPSNEVQLQYYQMSLNMAADAAAMNADPTWQTQQGNFFSQWGNLMPNLTFGFDAGNHLYEGTCPSLLTKLRAKGIFRFIAENHVLYPYYFSSSTQPNLTGTIGSLTASDFLTDSTGQQFNYMDSSHGEDMTQASVLNDWKNVLSEASAEGFQEYYADDFCWPYNAYFGYGANTVAAFRSYLNGTDAGLVLNNGTGGTTTVNFWGYLALYTNVSITPAMAGCSSWSTYTPSTSYSNSSVNTFLWNALCHYAMVQFLQKGGAYGATKGLMVTPTLNGQSLGNGTDYYVMGRLNGVEKLGYDALFGAPGYNAYHDTMYIASNANKYGHRIALIGEIGSGGNNHPYEAWNSVYARSYDYCAGLDPYDYNNQYECGYWWQIPTSNSLFSSWAAWAAGALGFIQSKADGGTIPPAKPAILVNDCGAGWTLQAQGGFNGTQWGSNNWVNTEDVTTTLTQVHCPFDRVGKPEMSNYIQNANVVFYCADVSSPAQITALTNWLGTGSGRYLITPMYGPFATDSATLASTGVVSNPMASLGLHFGSVSTKTITLSGNTASMSTISLTSLPSGSSVVLSDTHGYPLITKIPYGSNWILYVSVDFSVDGVGNASQTALDRALASAVMTTAGLQAEATVTPAASSANKDIHIHPVPGGTSAVVWDINDINTNQTAAGYYQRESNATVGTTTVSFPAQPNTAYTFYDFFNNTVNAKTSSSTGQLSYNSNSSVDVVYYGLASNATFANTIAALQKTRAALNYVNPSSGNNTMPSPAPVPACTLGPGQYLQHVTGADQAIYSVNGQYRLVDQSGDGNVVLYNSSNAGLWSTHTWNNPYTTFFMQWDGNLVGYNSGGNWLSNTSGNPGAYMVLLNSGRVEVCNSAGASILWSAP